MVTCCGCHGSTHMLPWESWQVRFAPRDGVSPTSSPTSLNASALTGQASSVRPQSHFSIDFLSEKPDTSGSSVRVSCRACKVSLNRTRRRSEPSKVELEQPKLQTKHPSSATGTTASGNAGANTLQRAQYVSATYPYPVTPWNGFRFLVTVFPQWHRDGPETRIYTALMVNGAWLMERRSSMRGDKRGPRAG